MSEGFRLEKRDLVGGNEPPADPYLAELEETNARLLTEQMDLELAAAKLPKEVTSDEHVAAITAHVVKARKLARETETYRTESKKPLLAKGRTLDNFFNGIKTNLLSRATDIEQRSAPYLAAKKAREEAAAKARAEEARKEQERIATAAREAREKAQREEEEAARERKRLADIATQEQANLAAAEQQSEADESPMDLPYVDQADTDAAEESTRQAELRAQNAKREADDLEAQAAKATKTADKAERTAEGGHRLARTAGGGGAANVETVWTANVVDRDAVRASLGPLGPYLAGAAVEDAIARCARLPERPVIPGVTYSSAIQTKTTASRG